MEEVNKNTKLDNTNKKLHISDVRSSKKFRVRCSLFNHSWNGGEFRQIEEYINGKNKTSVIDKFVKTNRTKMNSFDYFSIEVKEDV
jgi:hypothetical protein